MTFIFLKIIDLTIGLRVSQEDELLGADAVMHGLLDTDDCDFARTCQARRKSSAAHNEKTVLDDASDRGNGSTSPGLKPGGNTTSFNRHTFLRKTFSHVMRRRECRFKPTTFSKSVLFDSPVLARSGTGCQPLRRRGRCATMPSHWSPRRDVVGPTNAERRGDEESREVNLVPNLVSPTTEINPSSSFVSNGQPSYQAITVYI